MVNKLRVMSTLEKPPLVKALVDEGVAEDSADVLVQRFLELNQPGVKDADLWLQIKSAGTQSAEKSLGRRVTQITGAPKPDKSAAVRARALRESLCRARPLLFCGGCTPAPVCTRIRTLSVLFMPFVVHTLLAGW